MLNINHLPFFSQRILHNKHEKKRKRIPNITKLSSACGSTLGISVALSLMMKKRGNFLKNAISIHKIFTTFKDLECKEKDVLILATGAISGGYLGGMLTDIKHIKEKTKEAVTQLIGNYITPTIFVGTCTKASSILKPFLTPKKMPYAKGILGTIGLYYGVVLGNKISNKINANIFMDKSKIRKLCWKDWSVQVDNACLVTSLSTNGTNIAKSASKVIPAAHLFSGYLIGIKQD